MNSINLWNELKRRNKLLANAGLAFLGLFVVLAAAAAIDTTEILGINRWIKPMKFAISITIFLWTMGWLMGHLKTEARKVWLISIGLTAMMIAEIVPIAGQAARGTTSHFNTTSTFNAAVFSFMGFMIVLNTLIVAYALYLFFKTPVDLSPAYLWGIRLGMLIFILASAEGIMMASMLRHSVGGPDGGPGLPFVNWSVTAGDLRISHFIGLHALQAVPLAGYLLDKFGHKISGIRPVPAVTIVAAVYFAMTAGSFIWALLGHPLISLN